MNMLKNASSVVWTQLNAGTSGCFTAPLPMLQLFVPMSIVGGALLIPLNLRGDQVQASVESNSINPSRFMQLTMTNIDDNSPILWCAACLLACTRLWSGTVGQGVVQYSAV